jgi:hypothetical protein
MVVHARPRIDLSAVFPIKMATFCQMGSADAKDPIILGIAYPFCAK